MKNLKNIQNEEPRLPPHPATNSWLAVVRAYNICSKAIAAQIAPAGLNLLQHEILINLLVHPGQSQQELATKCFSAKSGISALVGNFEKQGMIIRHSSEDDARKKLLFLTDKGLEQARKNFEIQNNIVNDIAEVHASISLIDLEKSMNKTSEVLKEKYL